MKAGHTVILVGLTKAAHLNGKVAIVEVKDVGGRWLVRLIDDALNQV